MILLTLLIMVGSKDRPKKAQSCTQDWYRTQLKGLQVMLLPGVNLSIRHLLPSGWEVMPGIPSAMLTPSDAVLKVAAMVKVGKTLGGSQLLNIANLPAVHYPFVLGIPRQMPCAPFTVEHQDAITDSLFLLLELFVTQDCSMMAFSSFCKQLLHEAMQDSGHLISTWWMFSHRAVLSSTCWYLRCRQNYQHDVHSHVACFDYATSSSAHCS